MNAYILMPSQSTSGIATFRRRLLRIHGTILTLVALGSAFATTIGWMTGTGLFGFMQQNPMVWVGLIQASVDDDYSGITRAWLEPLP